MEMNGKHNSAQARDREHQSMGDTLCVQPTMESVERVAEFIEGRLEALEVPAKTAVRLKIALDEIFSNIVRYSGASQAQVGCLVEQGVLKLTFQDNGMPYDPLQAKEPDITASAEEREIGGLGIFMVRRMMDSVDYAYREGQNVLTLGLALPQG